MQRFTKLRFQVDFIYLTHKLFVAYELSVGYLSLIHGNYKKLNKQNNSRIHNEYDKKQKNKGDAMTDKEVTQKGIPFNLADHITYAIGSAVSKTLLKKDTGNITLFSFDAGQGLSEHTSPYDAVVYILEGQAQITIGGKPQTVQAGEMLIMPADVPHALHAEEQFKMLLIMIREV
jgi:quercetin dioxygenase-like cupin family protein